MRENLLCTHLQGREAADVVHGGSNIARLRPLGRAVAHGGGPECQARQCWHRAQVRQPAVLPVQPERLQVIGAQRRTPKVAAQQARKLQRRTVECARFNAEIALRRTTILYGGMVNLNKVQHETRNPCKTALRTLKGS